MYCTIIYSSTSSFLDTCLSTCMHNEACVCNNIALLLFLTLVCQRQMKAEFSSTVSVLALISCLEVYRMVHSFLRYARQ